MNDSTLFLAQIIGPTLGLIGLGMLIDKNFYHKLYKNVMEPNLAYLLTTMLMIIGGIVFVSRHFLWDTFTEGLVSFLGLAVLVKGIALALVPTGFNGLVKSVISTGLLAWAGIIWLIGGAYLSYVGFLMN